MGVPGAHGRRRWIAAIAVAAGLALAGVVSPPHALAAGSSITGVVEDTSGTPQGNVTVNVLDPATDATDATTTTDPADGTFTVSVDFRHVQRANSSRSRAPGCRVTSPPV